MEDNKEKAAQRIMEHYAKRMDKLRRIKVDNLQKFEKKSEEGLLNAIRNRLKI